MEGRVDQVAEMEAELSSLQAQIATLKAVQQSQPPSVRLGGRIRDALLRMGEELRGEKMRQEEVELSRLKVELEELEKELSRQTRMNGVTLINCITETVKRSDRGLLQRFCLTGHCSDIFFQVEFQVRESKEGQMSERTISNLHVVMDSTEHRDFSGFVSGVEERGDLLIFFRTLRTFSENLDNRRRTFQHFQEKYPQVVSLPGGCRSEVMTLHHPQLPGCILLVHWSVEVTREGGVTPKIDLLTKIPETALQLGSAQAIEGAPEAFHSLLRILGTEAALESLIMAVST
ncbi:centromere protein P [Lampris incognitus]|uniref:centromere protein P n=1 Tax=Lampris incognitus TaxID=2546036 RepID=UPI0024B5F40E|nr:centromere protein P [Lampris incognitus]